jgi:hypothetical protein
MNSYRSLLFKRQPDKSLLQILERLTGEGYLQNNRRLGVHFDCSQSARFVEVICSLENVETLDLLQHELAPDVLARVFQSCPKLTELYIATYLYKTLGVAGHLKNQLRPGFQKLRRIYLRCSIDNDTWPVIQEMLT